jgi:hypothetical protein
MKMDFHNIITSFARVYQEKQVLQGAFFASDIDRNEAEEP